LSWPISLADPAVAGGEAQVGNSLAFGDVRVLDFSHALAGPYATQSLADLGAEVIKVERPGRGDGARYMGEPMFGDEDSDYFVSLNRSKKSVLIDLHRPEGIDLARGLARQCDVVVQNFRPGVLDRLGLGFEHLRSVRRQLVYCSISAFGASGPWRNRPANDLIMQSVSGLMGVTGELGGGPVKVGTPICDYVAGLYALAGIATALRVRDDHPDGQHVEVSMLEATTAVMSTYVPAVLDAGKQIPRLGRAHPQLVPYQAFRCSDDKYVMVGAFTNSFWRRLCTVIGHPEWRDDRRFASNASRLANRALLTSQLDEIFSSKPADAWLELLRAADIPVSPVTELHDALRSEAAQHCRLTQEVRDTDRSFHAVRFPIRSEQWPERRATFPPKMGEHTWAVLRGLLRLGDPALQKLAEDGVIAGVSDSVNDGESEGAACATDRAS
jgi:crotonobetainyl-CoA:carnitine CoA-transferase CaiB-like acyl-CoA transferase